MSNTLERALARLKEAAVHAYGVYGRMVPLDDAACILTEALATPPQESAPAVRLREAASRAVGCWYGLGLDLDPDDIPPEITALRDVLAAPARDAPQESAPGERNRLSAIMDIGLNVKDDEPVVKQMTAGSARAIARLLRAPAREVPPVTDGPEPAMGVRATEAEATKIAAAFAVDDDVERIRSNMTVQASFGLRDVQTLLDALAAARAEQDKLQRDADSTYCAYCGHATLIADRDAATLAMTEHIRTCPKHPMRAVEAEVARMRAGRGRLLEAVAAIRRYPVGVGTKAEWDAIDDAIAAAETQAHEEGHDVSRD